MKVTRPILVCGGGEYGSAIASYLWLAHLPVVIIVTSEESYLRRPVCFAEAAFSGKKEIEGIKAVLINENILDLFTSENLYLHWQDAIQYQLENQTIPLIISGEIPEFIEKLVPDVIVKTTEDNFRSLQMENAKCVIGLHPYHQVNVDCHISIETRMNYWLGSVYKTTPIPSLDFDVHFFKQAFSTVHSPLEGTFISQREIGEQIRHNEALGKIDDIEIRSPNEGQIWGLFHSGRIIHNRQPMALIYEGKTKQEYRYFDFRSRAIAGSVLREILHFYNHFI
jgi:xanthine dehydrogenase accessory factor